MRRFFYAKKGGKRAAEAEKRLKNARKSRKKRHRSEEKVML